MSQRLGMGIALILAFGGFDLATALSLVQGPCAAVELSGDLGLGNTNEAAPANAPELRDNPGIAIGDMNCDGLFDYDDINPFILALSDPNAYWAEFPLCEILHGDANCDGAVDFVDISLWVDCAMCLECPPCTCP